MGVTLASHVQFTSTVLYRQVQAYLFGQAATMTDVHIYVYGGLALIIIAAISLLYKELQAITFDRQYAQSLGFSVRSINAVIFTLIVLAIVIGIRSVGVVLMSAMLVAPPVAARQFSHRLSTNFLLAALFGIISGFLGNYLSIAGSQTMEVITPA